MSAVCGMDDIAIIDLDLKNPAWLRVHSAMRTAQSAYVVSAAKPNECARASALR
jgi:hypothetical protein